MELNIKDAWPDIPFENAYLEWKQIHGDYTTLPGLLSQTIWKSRNLAIFQNCSSSTKQTLFSFWQLFHQYAKPINKPQNTIRTCLIPLEEIENVTGFFDGVAVDHICAAGFTIKCGQSLVLKFHLNGGMGTNTKVKLLGFWGILKVALLCGLDTIRIFGDSSVIINWANKKANLKNVSLQNRCNKTFSLMDKFQNISIAHTYRENNTMADALSNLSIEGDLGTLLWEEWVDELLLIVSL